MLHSLLHSSSSVFCREMIVGFWYHNMWEMFKLARRSLTKLRICGNICLFNPGFQTNNSWLSQVYFTKPTRQWVKGKFNCLAICVEERWPVIADTSLCTKISLSPCPTFILPHTIFPTCIQTTELYTSKSKPHQSTPFFFSLYLPLTCHAFSDELLLKILSLLILQNCTHDKLLHSIPHHLYMYIENSYIRFFFHLVFYHFPLFLFLWLWCHVEV